jgi:hypothetical protein
MHAVSLGAVSAVEGAALEHFRNTRRLFESSERWLFLEEKATLRLLSVYTNSENALACISHGQIDVL